jgi:acetoin utilization deacetylase AcuC-like enzyme
LSKIIELKPEFLLFSEVFDAHKDNPLTQLKLNSNDFYTLTKRTLEASKKFCNGKVVSILEGGYDLNALMSSTEKNVYALIEFN